MSIPGVTVANFLRHAVTNVRNPDRKEGEDLIPMRDFRKELRAKMDELGIDQEFARRYLNDGFSGGEKKRAEILQMAMLRPEFAILDETDSGLDIDAVRLVSQSIAEIGGRRDGHPDHHALRQLLEHIKPEFVHIIFGGRIVETRRPGAGRGIARERLRLDPRGIPRSSRRRSRMTENDQIAEAASADEARMIGRPAADDRSEAAVDAAWFVARPSPTQPSNAQSPTRNETISWPPTLPI